MRDLDDVAAAVADLAGDVRQDAGPIRDLQM